MVTPTVWETFNSLEKFTLRLLLMTWSQLNPRFQVSLKSSLTLRVVSGLSL